MPGPYLCIQIEILTLILVESKKVQSISVNVTIWDIHLEASIGGASLIKNWLVDGMDSLLVQNEVHTAIVKKPELRARGRAGPTRRHNRLLWCTAGNEMNDKWMRRMQHCAPQASCPGPYTTNCSWKRRQYRKIFGQRISCYRGIGLSQKMVAQRDDMRFAWNGMDTTLTQTQHKSKTTHSKTHRHTTMHRMHTLYIYIYLYIQNGHTSS